MSFLKGNSSIITSLIFTLRRWISNFQTVELWWQNKLIIVIRKAIVRIQFLAYFLESPHQVDMKNVVKCYKHFFCYFNALKTHGDWGSPLVQFWKFKNFLWVCWFLCKNLSNFIYPVWKLHNPYCNTVQTALANLFWKFIHSTISLCISEFWMKSEYTNCNAVLECFGSEKLVQFANSLHIHSYCRYYLQLNGICRV